MKFNIIVAMDNNRGIGLNNKLPWSFKEDMKYFKNLTKGAGNNAIIMGKNTYLSINKALPFRDNIILSSTLQDVSDTIVVCKSMKELFDFVQLKKSPIQMDIKMPSALLDIEHKQTPRSSHDRKCMTWPAKTHSKNNLFEPIETITTVFREAPKSTLSDKDTNYDDIWIIGGSAIYKQFLDMPEYIDKIFITHIDNDYKCDTFFPELPDYYKLINSSISNDNDILLNFKMYINNY